MKRQYKVAREYPSSNWFYGYVRFRRWGIWTRWQGCCTGSQDRQAIERMIDKYESEQPDSYLYQPQKRETPL